MRGEPMLAWVLDTALAVPALDPVVLVLGAHAAAVRAGIDLDALAPDIVVVDTPDWEQGVAASLRAGVAAAGDADAVVVLLGDMPFVTPQVVAGALDRLTARVDVVRTTYGGRPGHPVVLGAAALRRVPDLRGDVGARALFGDMRVREWEAGQLCDPADIDTREQLPPG